MNILLSTIGRMKKGPEQDLMDRYEKRIKQSGRGIGLSGFSVAEHAESRADTSKLRKTQEADWLLARHAAGTPIIALDERGKSIDSASFAKLVQKELDTTDEHIDQLNNEIAQLQQKLNDARAKQQALVNRGRTVESRIKVKRQINRDALDDAFRKFDQFERRMDNLEGQLDSMDIGRDVAPDLAAEIDALAEDEKINDELERLKKEIGGNEQTDQ